MDNQILPFLVFQEQMYKIRLTPYRKGLSTIFHRQTKGHHLISLDGRYRFYIDEDCHDPDFWVIQGKGLRWEETCHVAPENTIVLTTEPRSVLVYPQEYIDQFGVVCTCQEKTKHSRVVFGPAILPWFIGYKKDANDTITEVSLDYDKLAAMPTPKKTRMISVITSDKAFSPGHIDRLHFVKKLKEHYGNQLDVYGRGINDFDDKWDVLAQYKYHIVIENSSQQYYWTEKMSDCLLAETFPFYYGCTNMSDYISRDAFIPIDIKKPDEAIKIIDEAIAEDIYEQRKGVLHDAKRMMLDKYNMFEYIASLCDQLDPSRTKQAVTIKPCHSGKEWHNFVRYAFLRKWYELKWRLFH